MELNQSNLDQLISELQILMCLQDWRIRAEIVTPAEMKLYDDNEDYLATVNKHRAHMSALIRVSNDGNYDFSDDWVQSVIHEMVHILVDDYIRWVEYKVGPDMDDDYPNTLKEKMVDTIARSIYNAWNVDFVDN